MTWYQAIRPVNQVHDIGLDASGRPQSGFDIQVVKAQSSTFEEEVIKLLEDAGVGVFGTTIFASSDAQLPSERSSPPFIKLRTTGGLASIEIQEEIDAYPRPTMIVIAVAQNYPAARALARAAHSALKVVRNQDVSPS